MSIREIHRNAGAGNIILAIPNADGNDLTILLTVSDCMVSHTGIALSMVQ